MIPEEAYITTEVAEIKFTGKNMINTRSSHNISYDEEVKSTIESAYERIQGNAKHDGRFIYTLN